MKLHVVKFRAVWFALSAIMIGASIAALAFWGLRQGIEFTGGSLVEVRCVGVRPTVTEVESRIEAALPTLGDVVVQPVGDQNIQLRFRSVTEGEHQHILQTLQTFGEMQELRFDAIGPVIGQELRSKSIKGLVVALLAILAYVAYAFRKVSAPISSWKYGAVTIFTAFHDVIVPLGVFAVLGHTHQIEIGTPFVAAILTILGYSITDTIVVMDRIRENLHKEKGTYTEIVERSVHQTFLRSFYTSTSTLLTLFAIFFFGGASLHEFSLSLIIGIAIGTYSSIFIASPLLVSWNNWSSKR